MGTLGCINDMMRRDKENRDLRKRNRERINETRDRLIKVGKGVNISKISIEQMEEIRKKTIEKEKLDNKKLFRFMLLFLLFGILAVFILWLIVS